INASPSTIYSELNGFETYNEWSVWYEKDPAAKYTIEGPDTGVGAKFLWESDSSDVGNGSMTIEEVEENKMILYRMQFGFPGEQFARFIIEPEGSGASKVTWTYEEKPASFGKAMYAFMDMEDFLGPDYEKGLKKLKDYIESKYEANSNISLINAEPINYLGIEATVENPTPDNISTKMAEVYGTLMNHMQQSGTEMTGMPLSVYTVMEEDKIGMICGMPVAEGTTVEHEEIKAMRIEGGKSIKAIHMGNYSELSSTYDEIKAYMATNNLEEGGNPYEIYITDPGEVTDTTQWVTHVFYPVN
ncbi:hypothetical protein E1176_07575, partial [Fulvivirga sp. RKSG066]|uniref:SRPBCC family protein n=1 Tax=Fulvivirga aurantia TaxID=2529383 RepID=UPI0012BBC3CD